MINCAECPRCKDVYPNKVDGNGNHFYICGMSGNIVYKTPRREKRYNGKGYIHFSVSSCGIYDTFEKAFNSMTQTERDRWNNDHFENKQLSIEDFLGRNE